MAARYSDGAIAGFLNETKMLPADYRTRIRLKDRRGHKEQALDLKGANGNSYRLILRQSDHNAMDFSVILALVPRDSHQIFRLRRYNGKSHEHTNGIEGGTFYTFHIHMATERYQDSSPKEDSCAEPTDRYGDFSGALACMLKDCAFEVPDDGQPSLFGEV